MKLKNSKIKGKIKEQIVAQYLTKKGWTILCQNKKILGVEIDILAQKKELCRLIEVKSIKKEEHIERILKPKQKERLKKAALSLCEDFPQGVQLFLALVNPKKEITFFEIS